MRSGPDLAGNPLRRLPGDLRRYIEHTPQRAHICPGGARREKDLFSRVHVCSVAPQGQDEMERQV
jgi:hypothetical protein